MLGRTLALLALAVCSSIAICAYAADTLPSAEAAILRALVLSKCHMPLTNDDKAYEETLRASLQVQMDRMWEELRAANPSENVSRAYETFSDWFARAKAAAEARIQNASCAELDQQTEPASR